jgi:hypothetical protein
VHRRGHVERLKKYIHFKKLETRRHNEIVLDLTGCFSD